MKNYKKQLINLRLFLLRDGYKRGEYLKRKKLFNSFGEKVWWQPYKIPTQPKLVKIGNNVKIATEVLFMEHDIIHRLFNDMTTGGGIKYKAYVGTIEIGNNVFIGARSIIMYNVKIGSNCIIGAGSVVTKNIPDGTVAAGVPAKPIGKTEDLKLKYFEYSKKHQYDNMYDDNFLEKFFW